MRYKIGIFGSAEGDIDRILSKADDLGKELTKHNIVLVTGASTGLPYQVAKTAAKLGTKVWGYSTAIDLASQQAHHPEVDSKVFDKFIFIPKTYEFASEKKVCMKYRNVTSTANCDAGIIISGRWGTLNEFTNLYDMGKVIGVLTGTGGIADELPTLMKKISKKSNAKVVFNNSPTELVNSVLAELKTRKQNIQIPPTNILVY